MVADDEVDGEVSELMGSSFSAKQMEERRKPKREYLGTNWQKCTLTRIWSTVEFEQWGDYYFSPLLLPPARAIVNGPLIMIDGEAFSNFVL